MSTDSLPLRPRMKAPFQRIRARSHPFPPATAGTADAEWDGFRVDRQDDNFVDRARRSAPVTDVAGGMTVHDLADIAVLVQKGPMSISDNPDEVITVHGFLAVQCRTGHNGLARLRMPLIPASYPRSLEPVS